MDIVVVVASANLELEKRGVLLTPSPLLGSVLNGLLIDWMLAVDFPLLFLK